MPKIITLGTKMKNLRHTSDVRVLIVGATGQDGSFLAENFLLRGHVVLGVSSVNSSIKRGGFQPLYADLSDSLKSKAIFDDFRPDWIFHMAAVHSSSASSELLPEKTLEQIYSCNVGITQNILEWQRTNLKSKSIISLSSQMYSQEISGTYINESSILNPRNYYAKTKVEAFSLMKKYRGSHGVHTSGAILFNHTSSRSKSKFLFPQLAIKISQLLRGETSEIIVRDPDAELDISDALEVSEGISKMVEIDQPTDFIFASGFSFKIHEIIATTINQLGFDGNYTIEREVGDFKSAPRIIGNPERALRLLNWKVTNSPEKILATMIKELENSAKLQ